jgi:hypothetical protein
VASFFRKKEAFLKFFFFVGDFYERQENNFYFLIAIHLFTMPVSKKRPSPSDGGGPSSKKTVIQ